MILTVKFLLYNNFFNRVMEDGPIEQKAILNIINYNIAQKYKVNIPILSISI